MTVAIAVYSSHRCGFLSTPLSERKEVSTVSIPMKMVGQYHQNLYEYRGSGSRHGMPVFELLKGLT